MSKYHVLAARDIVANVFLQPIFVTHIAIGKRNFGDECKNPQAAFGKHPEDYELLYLGEFDDTTGHIDQDVAPDGTPNTIGRPIQIDVGANYRAN